MSHGERSSRLRNNSTREYWSHRADGRFACVDRPTRGHHDPKSVKRMTNRIERRTAKQKGYE